MYLGSLVILISLALVAIVVVIGRRRGIGWGELAVLSLVYVVAVAGLPAILSAATSGRAALGETSPWVWIIATGLAFAWVALRRRRRPADDHGNGVRAAPASPPAGPTRAGADAAPPPGPAPAGSVFLSYRRTDSDYITGRIYDRLVQRFGAGGIYKDVDTIPLGVDFRDYIGELVGRCDVLIAVIGPQWLSVEAHGQRRIDDPRDPVRTEVAAALTRDIPVIPLLVGGAAIPEESALPGELGGLAYRNGIPVRPDPDFHKDLDRLIEGLESHFRSSR